MSIFEILAAFLYSFLQLSEVFIIAVHALLLCTFALESLRLRLVTLVIRLVKWLQNGHFEERYFLVLKCLNQISDQGAVLFLFHQHFRHKVVEAG